MDFSNAGTRARFALAGSALAAMCAIGASDALATSGTTYYASATSTASSPCTQAAPCRLDHAVAAANTDGDTVIVEPGSYGVSYGVTSGHAITIEGAPGQAWPTLVGASNLGGPVLTANGATVQDLVIESTSTAGAHPPALQMSGGTAQDLVLSASAADTQGKALSITGAAAPTTVRTVLATSQAANGAAVVIANPGKNQVVTLINVTAVGTTSTTAGIAGNVAASATSTVIDSIVIGGSADFTRTGGNGTISAAYSDFRPAASTGITDAGHNQSAAPVFAAGYTEAASSPTVAAGIASSWQTPTDLAGRGWNAGVGPDMGAYEYIAAASSGSDGSGGGSQGGNDQGGNSQGGNDQGGSTGGSTGGSDGNSSGGSGGDSSGTGAQGNDDGTKPVPSGYPIAAHGPALPPAAPPAAGHSVALHPDTGTVGVELPHSHVFVALTQASTIPVGSVIDASRGKVLLTSVVSSGGAVKTGAFTGGAFRVVQTAGPHPLTDLTMAGGSFAACTRTVGIVHSTRSRRPSHRVVRQLWGSDSGGRFVTAGRTASAAVRGTVWLTQDRCDGTYVHVLRGHVVVRNKVNHRNVVLGPGQSYLARAAR